MALAILMAVWVNNKLKGQGFVRLAYFTPTILPMVAVASIWLFFYSPGIGTIDQILGMLGLPTLNWLGNTSTVLPAMMVMMIWKRSEEHTSELQSRGHLVCRLLLEKKKLQPPPERVCVPRLYDRCSQ